MHLLYIDLFCGAGGTSTGVELAKVNEEKCAKVIACINHDKNAIASHAMNHPNALHFTEDIRTLELSSLIDHVNTQRRRYPDAHVVLWASLECTNFSRAKGGQPRNADSRTLAEHLFRYIDALNPDYLQIENVEEFMSWGKLDEKGKPLSRYKGIDYLKWVSKICDYGYRYDYRILNAADFGAYTSRKRYFGVFAKRNLPIVFPEQTHAKTPVKDIFGDSLKQWNAVRDMLDLSDKGESIFNRKKPLVDATLERIYAGLIKFVAGGKDAFLIKWNSKNGNSYNAPGIDEPCPTVVTQDRLGIAHIDFFINYYSGGGQFSSLNNPCPAITTKQKQSLVTCEPFIMNPQFSSAGGSTKNPCFTLIARMDKRPPYLISPESGIGNKLQETTDTHVMVQIKEFMQLYGIADIKMRMLRVPELKKIMGFPAKYMLVGTQNEQKKFIGNAVEVTMSKVLCEALSQKLMIRELQEVVSL